MYTAEMARQENMHMLDERISHAVKDAVRCGHTTGSIRVYIDDTFLYTIKEELEKRGFFDINVPDITLKGDVYFSW